MTLFCTVF